jgi:hypothetical protein
MTPLDLPRYVEAHHINLEDIAGTALPRLRERSGVVWREDGGWEDRVDWYSRAELLVSLSDSWAQAFDALCKECRQRAESLGLPFRGTEEAAESPQPSRRDTPSPQETSSRTTLSSEPRRKALLRDRPPGWEYLLFASYLVDRIERLEDRYVAFELGLVHPTGRRLDRDELTDVLQSELDNAQQIISKVNRLFDQRFVVTAFGEPGQPGNPDRIRFFAQQLVSVYDDMLHVCERLRSVSTTEEDRHVVYLQSLMLGTPIQEIRHYVARWQALAEDLPRQVQEAVRSGTSLNVDEMKLTLTIDQQLAKELKADWARLRKANRRRA